MRAEVNQVRRRLFDEGEDSTADKISPKNSPVISAPLESIEQKSSTSVLIVTEFGESSHVLSSRATSLSEVNINLLQCLPADALRQCSNVTYDVIFTDIDLSRSNETLGTIMSIRNDTNNNNTPIVAVDQSYYVNDLSYYGLTEVYKGKLDEPTIIKIFAKYLNASLIKAEHESLDPPDITIIKSPTEVCLSASEKDPSCQSTGGIFYNTLDKSRQPMYSSNESYRSIYRTTIPRFTRYSSSTSVEQAKKPSFDYPSSRFPGSNLSNNIPYMISGEPGTSSMRITMLPDDCNKHSTKERVRRQRIKQSCDEMRDLLPKCLAHDRKLDMATVLELAVLYMRIMHAQSPADLQTQCSQTFQSVYKLIEEKRRYIAETQQTIKNTTLKPESSPHGNFVNTTLPPEYLPYHHTTHASTHPANSHPNIHSTSHAMHPSSSAMHPTSSAMHIFPPLRPTTLLPADYFVGSNNYHYQAFLGHFD